MRKFAVILFACLPAAALAAPAKPALTQAQHDAAHAMFEHVINTPTVIGRHNVPAMAKYLAGKLEEMKAMEPIDGKPAAYVCENFMCKAPVTSIEELRKLLGR